MINTATALSLAAGAGALGSIYSGRQQAKGYERAGAESALASRQAQEMLGRQYGQIREDVAPYREAGTEALDLYRDIVLGGDMSRFYTSPGYQFRLGEGVKALEKGAAARGSLLSGAQQKALTEFGQELASREYSNYLNRIAGLSQTGLEASLQTGRMGLQTAQQQGQLGMAGAQAYGQGILGRETARGQMVSGAIGGLGAGLGAYSGYLQQQQLLNALTGGV